MENFVLITLTVLCACAGIREFVKNKKEINVPTGIYACMAFFFFSLATAARFNILSAPVTEDNPVFQFTSMGGALAVVSTLFSVVVLIVVRIYDKIKGTA